MRVAAGILSVVALLLVVLIASFFAGGTLSVGARAVSVPASDALQAFDSVVEVLDAGIAPQVFSGEEIGDASGYVLIDINFDFRNRGLFAAEWLTAELAPAPGDVAVYSKGTEAIDVPARGGNSLNLKVIARAGGDLEGRELKIEYYVLGMRRTAKVACSE